MNAPSQWYSKSLICLARVRASDRSPAVSPCGPILASVRQTAKARESARDIAWSRTRTLRFDLVTIAPGAAEFPSLQLAGILRERILTGQYPAGRKIPAFVALEQEFTLSGM